MPAPMRSTAGRALVSNGGAPLLVSPANAAPLAGEPAAPAGWSQVFFDDFAGTTLDRGKWKIVFGGSRSSNNTQEWRHENVLVGNGLTLRVSSDASGFAGAGVQQGKATDAGAYHQYCSSHPNPLLWFHYVEKPLFLPS